ncbi:MAG: hypothetical protein U1E53_17265 [Dongiaceae bacterium]
MGGIAVLALGLGALMGCANQGSAVPAGVAKPVAAAAIAPAPAPVYQTGQKFSYSDGTATIVQTVTVSSDGVQSWTSSDGWEWSKKAYLERGRSWKSKDGEMGRQDFTADLDAIFPLQVGKTVTTQYSGSSNKDGSWTGTQTCNVADTESVTVPAGTFDTYKVVCRFGKNPDQPYTTITHWYAPKAGTDVLYKEYTPDRGKDELMQLVPNAA